MNEEIEVSSVRYLCPKNVKLIGTIVLDILMKSLKSLAFLATMFLLSGFRPFTTMKNTTV